MKRSSPRTEPCGNPDRAVATANEHDPTRIKNDSSDRYDLIHRSGILHIAKSHKSFEEDLIISVSKAV